MSWKLRDQTLHRVLRLHVHQPLIRKPARLKKYFQCNRGSPQFHQDLTTEQIRIEANNNTSKTSSPKQKPLWPESLKECAQRLDKTFTESDWMILNQIQTVSQLGYTGSMEAARFPGQKAPTAMTNRCLSSTSECCTKPEIRSFSCWSGHRPRDGVGCRRISNRAGDTKIDDCAFKDRF